jgi:predicted nucleic acid-binding protein
MIFIDSNVLIYAVGKPHPLRREAQEFFLNARKKGFHLVSSAEVMQELLHVYLPVERWDELDAAFSLMEDGVDEVFPIDKDLVLSAKDQQKRFPGLTARDLLHLATCQKWQVNEVKTFDRSLAAAFKKIGPKNKN